MPWWTCCCICLALFLLLSMRARSSLKKVGEHLRGFPISRRSWHHCTRVNLRVCVCVCMCVCVSVCVCECVWYSSTCVYTCACKPLTLETSQRDTCKSRSPLQTEACNKTSTFISNWFICPFLLRFKILRHMDTPWALMWSLQFLQSPTNYQPMKYTHEMLSEAYILCSSAPPPLPSVFTVCRTESDQKLGRGLEPETNTTYSTVDSLINVPHTVLWTHWSMYHILYCGLTDQCTTYCTVDSLINVPHTVLWTHWSMSE